jgi:hypothetical protein
MADATLLALFRELVASYDSTISTDPGAAFRTSVIDPFLKRIGDSVLDVDLETFLVDRLSSEHSDLDVSQGSGIRDLVIRPMATMLAPVRREIRALSTAQSLNNYESMTRGEVDALLGNFFLSIQEGGLATGVVRVYFSAPQAAVIDSLVKFSTEEGQGFYPTSITSITSASMSLNREAGLYYVDVPVQAEENGTSYNITKGAITKVETIIGAVKVTNKLGFDSGIEDETKEEAVTRARSSITTRTLATSRGISTLITESYASIDTLQVIGFGDPEMQRDFIAGPQSISGIPGGFQGAADADLTTGVHIGGKTDVYVYQPSRITQVLDIKDITDVGRRIVRGSKGYSPGSGSLDTFLDDSGQFLSNGVLAGDILRFASDTVTLTETTISAVTSDTLTVTAGDVPLSLSQQPYEVVRKDSIEKYVDVGLHDLVAIDSLGQPILSSGVPVRPVPGDLDLTALSYGGVDVQQISNIAVENIQTPLMSLTSVSVLDPTQFTLTGETYPVADPLFAQALTAFTGGTGASKATGTVRVYFKGKVGAFFPGTTTAAFTRVEFTDADGRIFVPDTLGTKVSTLVGGTSTFTVGGDVTADFTRGRWVAEISTGSGLHMISSSSHSTGTTTVTVRFDDTVSLYTAGSRNHVLHQGVNYQDILQDSDTGLYYVDLAVSAEANGTAYNIAREAVLTTANIYSEGVSLRNLESGTAFSTRERPYLRFTNYVNDQNLRKASTAYSIRLAYEHADTLSRIQSFVELDDNRIISEDLLVKHFLPGRVSAKITLSGVTDAQALAAVESFLETLDPASTLEVSDLVKALYDAGATYVQLPLTLVVLTPSQDRILTGTTVQDRVPLERTRHFVLETGGLTVTVSS